MTAYVDPLGPWRAAVAIDDPGPARLFAALVGQAVRNRLPARLLGPAAVAVRGGIPEGALARAIRVGRRRERPDLDALVVAAVAAWPALASRARWLPPDPPPLTTLALDRRAGLTVFLLEAGAPSGRLAPPVPLVVLKVAAAGHGGVAVEQAALRAAEGAAIGPRLLGAVAGAVAQEGLPGRPLAVRAITPAGAASLDWPAAFDDLVAGLARLAAATARPGRPVELRDGLLDRDWSATGVAPAAVGAVARARSELDAVACHVVKHSDTSPQNCLFGDGRLVGLVDWEMATVEGTPGFDALNAALSWFEHGIGLVRWSDRRVADCFEVAWNRSPFMAGARAALRTTIAAAGLDEAFAPPLEVAYFARRLARRLDAPGDYPTGPPAAARMLEVVCGS